MDKPTTRKLISNSTRLVRIAAILLFIAGLTFIIRNYFLHEPEMIVYASGQNKSEVLLSDGSRVHLNQNSKLTYPEKFAGKERTVFFSGEGYFEVTKNEKRSFAVNTINNGRIEVLGTSFNINDDTTSGKVELTVTSGKVAFYKSDKTENKTILIQNEKAVLKDNKITKAEIEDLNFLSWKTGILVFENNRLEKVVLKLADLYKQPIIIYDQTIKDLKYTSTIDNQTLNEVLDEINLVFNLTHLVKNDTVFIYPNH